MSCETCKHYLYYENEHICLKTQFTLPFLLSSCPDYEERGKNVLFYGSKGNYQLAREYLLEQGFVLVTEEEKEIDLIVSYLYDKKIPLEIINKAKFAINFHPSPLPEGRNSRTYPFAILEKRNIYTVTCHYLEESFDTGEIIHTLTFPINHEFETCISLKLKAYDYLFILFKEVIDYYLKLGHFPKSYKQDESKAQSCTLEELEKMKDLTNVRGLFFSAKDLKRYIRAFFHPPYHTMNVVIDGEKFSLISQELLEEIAQNYKPKAKSYIIAECGIIVNPTKEEEN